MARNGATTRGASARRPIAVDLFAGAGGLSLSFEQAGFDVVCAVEYDPVHAVTHMFNFPRCFTICRDVRTLSGKDVIRGARAGYHQLHPDKAFPRVIDAVIGGPPCQGFSTGGKREAADHRNGHLLEFVRLVEEVRPLTFCLENVVGLLTAPFNPILVEAVDRLVAAGYSISGHERSLNSYDFGVPQTRHRVFIVGMLEGRAPQLPRGLERAVSVYEAFEGLPNVSRYTELRVKDSVRLNRSDQARREQSKSTFARQAAGLDPILIDMGVPRIWDRRLATGLRLTTHAPETVERFRLTAPGKVEPKGRLYRLSWDRPARTLRAGSGSERGAHTAPRPIHSTEDRVITVREAARLHGYPDWFRFHVTNWHGHRQIGNSVPPPLGRAVALCLLEVLGVQPIDFRGAIALGASSMLSLSSTKAQTIAKAVQGQLPPPRRKTDTSVVRV